MERRQVKVPSIGRCPAFDLWLDQNDDLNLTKHIHDGLLARVMAALIQPGDVVIDVGAHIGFFTVLMSNLVGPEGHVLAFEPAPDTLDILRENLFLNGLQNVSARQMAIGNGNGLTELYLTANTGDRRTYDPGMDPQPPKIKVPMRTLDDFLPHLATGEIWIGGRYCRVAFMKIDVQGSELAVLRGAQSLIEQGGVEKLALEFWPTALAVAGADPFHLLNFLEFYGFRFFDLVEPVKWICPVKADTLLETYKVITDRSELRIGDFTNLLCLPKGVIPHDGKGLEAPGGFASSSAERDGGKHHEAAPPKIVPTIPALS